MTLRITGDATLSPLLVRAAFPNVEVDSEIGWFLERLRRKTTIEGECWIWHGYTKNRYPSLSMRNVDVYAHRVVCDLAHGLADGEEACHSCDRPACWNPAHLFPGSHADNVADCVAKRRNSPPPHHHGERNPKAWLTDVEVAEIRTEWDSPDRPQQRELAAAYGCSQSTIWRIVHSHVRGIEKERA